MANVFTDTVRKVYWEGHFIEVGPDGDGVGCVEVRTTGESAEFFGRSSLMMRADVARALAQALLKAADEAEEVK